MRILLATGIYPPDVGGPATYTRAMAQALLAEGHAVEVVCYADRAEGREDAWPVHRVSRSLSLPVRYLAYAWKTFRAALRSDVVYLQGPVSEGFPGTFGALLAGKPRVMKIVGDYAWECYMQEDGNNRELLDDFAMHRHAGRIGMIEGIERWTATRATRIVVPSFYLKKITERWGVPRERIEIIYNSIEPLPKGKSRAEARQTFGVEGKRVLFSAIRAVPWKHADFIIGLLPKLGSDIVYVIAGDGPYLPVWRAAAEKHGIADRVRFLGRTDHAVVGEWYRAADLFILPSGYEGFPHVVAEAASCGLPSFVSDRGGNPETQELFGRPLVRVLPYLDRVAWQRALSETWPPRVSPEAVRMTPFQAMLRSAEAVLQSVV